MNCTSTSTGTKMDGFRYIVEKGGVPYDERGYLRNHWTQIGEYKQRWMWSDLRNCTQFISEEAARSAAEKSGLDGFKVLIKVNAFDEFCQAYDNKEWLWENMGGV